MKHISHPPQLGAAISQFEQAGGVVEYVLFELMENEIPDFAVINQQALAEICKEWPDNAQTFEASKMASQKVTPEQLLGPHYDLAAQQLIVRGTTSEHLNDFFHHDDQEGDERKIPFHRWYGEGSIYKGFATQGYTDAFADPPYRLLLSNPEKGRLSL